MITINTVLVILGFVAVVLLIVFIMMVGLLRARIDLFAEQLGHTRASVEAHAVRIARLEAKVEVNSDSLGLSLKVFDEACRLLKVVEDTVTARVAAQYEGRVALENTRFPGPTADEVMRKTEKAAQNNPDLADALRRARGTAVKQGSVRFGPDMITESVRKPRAPESPTPNTESTDETGSPENP